MINMIATTGFDTMAKGPMPQGDASDIDLYADLFAAFFTVPPPMPVTEPMPVQTPVGEQAVDAAPMPETVLNADNYIAPEIPGLLPPADPIKWTINAEPILIKPNDTPASTLGPRKPVFPVLPPLIAKKPVELLGPPLGIDPDKKPEMGENYVFDPQEVDPSAVRDLPTPVVPVVKVTERPGGVQMILPTDHMPVDTITIDDYDHPIEAEVLEIPVATTPVRHEREDSILEIQSSPTVREPVNLQDVQAAFAFSAFEHKAPQAEVAESGKVNLKEKEITEVQPEVKPETTYLETFATNVLVDSRPKEALRTTFTTKKEITIETGFEDTIRPVEEKLEGDGATEFSFESALSGETSIQKPEKPSLSDAKIKRIIYDHVGSTVKDMLLNEKQVPDQRVIKIHLKPAELGSVEITLAKNADGVINAHFKTENPHTQHLLNETLAQLRDSLDGLGIKVGSLDTSCSTSFSGGERGGGEKSVPTNFDAPKAERTTFDEVVRTDEPKSSRLLNLRA